MVKGVIFDWDGTVVQNTDLWHTAFNMTLNDLGFPPITLEQFSKLIDREKVERTFGITEAEMMKGFDVWVANYEKLRKNAKLVSGIDGLIKKLKEENYKTAVVTGGGKDRVMREVKEFKLGKFFDVVVTHDDAIYEKPHPNGLKLALGGLKLKPEECVYIGDMNVDVLAAKNCGMASIAVSWGSHDIEELKKTNPHHTANDLSELYDVIKQL